jgi:hypothetical protein
MRLVSDRLSRESRPKLRYSVLPDSSSGVVSLETASLPEVPPMGRPTDSKDPAALGHCVPLEDAGPSPDPRLLDSHRLDFLPRLSGSAFQGRVGIG